MGSPPKTDAEKAKYRDELKAMRKAPKKLSENGIPMCPKHGLDLEMVKRKSYLGEFWGCPRYPKCLNKAPIKKVQTKEPTLFN